ncbi:MAG: hypothetical protein AAFU79_32610 [Myxococcota bacterium]
MKIPIEIPGGLTAEEALCITSILEQVTAALWRRHQDEMIERLDRHRQHARADPRCPVCQPHDENLPL